MVTACAAYIVAVDVAKRNWRPIIGTNEQATLTFECAIKGSSEQLS